MPEIVGIKRDAETFTRARDTVAEIENATVRIAPFDSDAFRDEPFDLVTFVAVLHHLPLAETLEVARRLLRPGGRLVIVGLAREVPADLPWSVSSVLLNPLIGLIRHPGTRRRFRRT